MNLLVKLIPNKICIGCACHGYVESKTFLCFSCFGLKIAVEDKKRKLSGTMREKFCPKPGEIVVVPPGMKITMDNIRRQIEEFRTKSASA